MQGGLKHKRLLLFQETQLSKFGVVQLSQGWRELREVEDEMKHQVAVQLPLLLPPRIWVPMILSGECTSDEHSDDICSGPQGPTTIHDSPPLANSAQCKESEKEANHRLCRVRNCFHLIQCHSYNFKRIMTYEPWKATHHSEHKASKEAKPQNADYRRTQSIALEECQNRPVFASIPTLLVCLVAHLRTIAPKAFPEFLQRASHTNDLRVKLCENLGGRYGSGENCPGHEHHTKDHREGKHGHVPMPISICLTHQHRTINCLENPVTARRLTLRRSPRCANKCFALLSDRQAPSASVVHPIINSMMQTVTVLECMASL
mmetsp:Transcript_49376/g.118791  ORF Transcript_49376/g.118791 Transcript_49376/m.118791 type:complete len:318 (-) Transcript_49376:286-1239(-)